MCIVKPFLVGRVRGELTRSFYLPKDSTKAQLLEAKANLLRLREDIPLADAELSAVEDGLAAYEQLLKKLADVPTPAGPTPRHNSAENISCNCKPMNSQYDSSIGSSLAAFDGKLEVSITSPVRRPTRS